MKFPGVQAFRGVRAPAATKIKAEKSFKQVLVIALVAGMLGMGCGQKEEEEFDGIACGSPDQYRSYMNPMDSTVIQTISIDSSLSSSQISKIEKAVHTWNTYGRRTIGRDLFRTQIMGLSANSVPAPSSDCGFPGTTGAFSIVKVTDTATWNALGFTKDNPGVTLRCSKGRDFASKQVILLNPNHMTDGLFETVVVHELGHAVGLDHSCRMNGGQANYVGCKGLGADHDYTEAAMYPYVSDSNHKEELRANDEERAQCALNYRP